MLLTNSSRSPRNGKSAAAKIAAIKMLKEWEKDDNPKEGWEDLDAAKPTLKAVASSPWTA